MRLFCIIIFGCLVLSCTPPERKISFVNQYEAQIDSLHISVASADAYTVKYRNIKSLDTVITAIPNNKPKSNKHDITISVTIFMKGEVIHRYNYNDLIGYLNRDYIIILNEKNEIEWK